MPDFSPTPSDDIYMVIKGLLEFRLNSTLAELQKDYDEKVGDNRLPRNFKDLRRLMQSIPDVECITNHYGLEMWQLRRSSTSSRKPEYKYMKKSSHSSSSKRSRAKSRASTSRGSSINSNQPKPKRQCQHPPASSKSSQKVHQDGSQSFLSHPKKIYMDGFYEGYQLMGDDFMLSLAKIDLGYKFTKDPESGRLCIGYCVSGLTIKGLAKIVRSSHDIRDHVIVYIGTVDILLGHKVENMKHDYYDLLSAFRERGIEPLLCTLAPIGEEGNKYDSLVTEFNCWLTNRKWTVVDIDRCFIDHDGKTIRSVYQKDPRNVSGCHVRHLLWNKLGRQRVLKRMKQFMGHPKY